MPDTAVAKLGASRCALTGAIVLAVLFVACWIAAAAGLTGSHMYIALFTRAEPASLPALSVGLCWSLVFGAATGALVAVVYNALAFIERRDAPSQRIQRT